MIAKSKQIELEKFMIDFGTVNGEKVYQRLDLDRLTNKERAEISGHVIKDGIKSGSYTYYTAMMKQGKYRASGFVKICGCRKADPREIITEFKPRVLKKTRRWFEVDESTANVVLNIVCDSYDNES
jgi:hypothetical protein